MFHIYVTIWLFNIAMENPPIFLWVNLYKWVISHGKLLNNQRVP